MHSQSSAYLLIALASLVVACNSGDHPSETADTFTAVSDSPRTGDTIKQAEATNKPVSVWTYDDNNSIAVRTGAAKIDTLTPVQLIEFFNATYIDSLQLEYQRISADTLFVRVLNADYLTQRSGSTGAEAYLQVGTFTLTESPRINYVYFDFEEGDHAVPGTYSRKQWYDRAERIRKMNRK